MKPFATFALPAALALAALGAECPGAPSQGVICTADYRYGLSVSVVDSVTGVAVPRPLLIVATEGAYSDTAMAARQTGDVPFTAWPLVGERAGTYAVLVRAPGYQDWQRSGVRVDRDLCHVIPVALTARLRRT